MITDTQHSAKKSCEKSLQKQIYTCSCADRSWQAPRFCLIISLPITAVEPYSHQVFSIKWVNSWVVVSRWVPYSHQVLKHQVNVLVVVTRTHCHSPMSVAYIKILTDKCYQAAAAAAYRPPNWKPYCCCVSSMNWESINYYCSITLWWIRLLTLNLILWPQIIIIIIIIICNYSYDKILQEGFSLHNS
jgi:hypothetical protein